MATRVRLAAVSDIPEGEGRVIETEGQDLAVYNVGGRFFAIENDCKHRGGPLGEGELDGTLVECPLHAWIYDVTTGECHDDPACHVKTFPVSVEGDELFVEI